MQDDDPRNRPISVPHRVGDEMPPVQSATELQYQRLLDREQPAKQSKVIPIIVTASVVLAVVAVVVAMYLLGKNSSSTNVANSAANNSSNSSNSSQNNGDSTYPLASGYTVDTSMLLEEIPNPTGWKKSGKAVGYTLTSADGTKKMILTRVDSAANDLYKTDSALTERYVDIIGRVAIGQEMATDKVATMAGGTSLVMVPSDHGDSVEFMRAEFTYKGSGGDYRALVAVRSGVKNTVYAIYTAKSTAWTDADAKDFVSKLRITYGAS